MIHISKCLSNKDKIDTWLSSIASIFLIKDEVCTHLQFFEQLVLNHISLLWAVSVRTAQKLKGLEWNQHRHISIISPSESVNPRVIGRCKRSTCIQEKNKKYIRRLSSARTYQVWERLIIRQTKASTVTTSRMQLIGQIDKVILNTRIWGWTKQYNLHLDVSSVETRNYIKKEK